MCVFNGTSLCAALLGSTLTFKSKPANALAAPRAPARPPLRTALWRRRTAGLRSLIGKHPNGRPCKHFYLWPFSFFRKQSFDSLAGGGLADAREPRAGGSVRGGRSECAITSSSCFQLSVPAPRPSCIWPPHIWSLSAPNVIKPPFPVEPGMGCTLGYTWKTKRLEKARGVHGGWHLAARAHVWPRWLVLPDPGSARRPVGKEPASRRVPSAAAAPLPGLLAAFSAWHLRPRTLPTPPLLSASLWLLLSQCFYCYTKRALREQRKQCVHEKFNPHLRLRGGL